MIFKHHSLNCVSSIIGSQHDHQCFFSKAESQVAASEQDSSTQAASELNEDNVFDDSEAECNECDNPEDSAALSST